MFEKCSYTYKVEPAEKIPRIIAVFGGNRIVFPLSVYVRHIINADSEKIVNFTFWLSELFIKFMVSIIKSRILSRISVGLLRNVVIGMLCIYRL